MYNMAVEEGLAPLIFPYLFKGVFTGIESKRKKRRYHRIYYVLLMTAPLDDPELRKTRQALCLMFQFLRYGIRGFRSSEKRRMSGGGVLEYKRQKTGTRCL